MTVLDPVCGMPVGEATGVSLGYGGQRLRFCSEFCKEQFLRHPGAYEEAAGGGGARRRLA